VFIEPEPKSTFALKTEVEKESMTKKCIKIWKLYSFNFLLYVRKINWIYFVNICKSFDD